MDIQEERVENLIPPILAAVVSGVVFGLTIVAAYFGATYAFRTYSGFF